MIEILITLAIGALAIAAVLWARGVARESARQNKLYTLRSLR